MDNDFYNPRARRTSENIKNFIKSSVDLKPSGWNAAQKFLKNQKQKLKLKLKLRQYQFPKSKHIQKANLLP